MKKNNVIIRNLANIVNRIVRKLHVIRWGSLKRRPADHIKIVITNFHLLFNALYYNILIFISRFIRGYLDGDGSIAKYGGGLNLVYLEQMIC
jgi:hypothetical protein